MNRKIVPLQREHAARIFQTEWAHQLSAMEQSVSFFEEYFLWASQQLSLQELDPKTGGSPEYAKFFNSESPMVVKEARDALRTLRLMARAEK